MNRNYLFITYQNFGTCRTDYCVPKQHASLEYLGINEADASWQEIVFEHNNNNNCNSAGVLITEWHAADLSLAPPSIFHPPPLNRTLSNFHLRKKKKKDSDFNLVSPLLSTCDASAVWLNKRVCVASFFFFKHFYF